MGPQGSGKGTQARMLAKKYNLQFLEMGNILRAIAKENTPIGHKIDEAINKKGEMVPWELIKEVLNKVVEKLDKNKGVLFDGTPRRMQEIDYWNEKFKEIDRKFDYIFYIGISQEESVKRISSRKLCKQYGHPLIVGKDISEKDTKCPICGSKVYRREDDTPEKVFKRLQWNETILKPVINYFKDRNMLIGINGEQNIKDVGKEILAHIK